MPNLTIQEVKEKLINIVDPYNGKTLGENNAIKHIGIDPDKDLVVLIVSIGKMGGLEEKAVRRALAKIVKIDLGFKGVKIQLEEKRKLESIVNRNVKFIIVMSGKGGVGKSTVAANLAYALKRKGKIVGIIDADIYGSSIPQVLEMKHEYPKCAEDQKIIPLEAFGMEVISTEFFAEEGKPIIWRGAMLGNMIENFFYEVRWNKNTDFIIIDSPPGTGDIPLDIRNIVPKAEALLVTTPHLAASHVAVKAGFAAGQLNHEIIGVIENMSYYSNPVNGEKEFIFGAGGGEKVATELNTELLCQIPITQPTHHLSLYESDEEIGKIYDDLADIVMIR